MCSLRWANPSVYSCQNGSLCRAKSGSFLNTACTTWPISCATRPCIDSRPDHPHSAIISSPNSTEWDPLYSVTQPAPQPIPTYRTKRTSRFSMPKRSEAAVCMGLISLSRFLCALKISSVLPAINGNTFVSATPRQLPPDKLS